MPPLAHATHWLIWVLYAVPVAIVLGSIALTVLRDRRDRGRAGDTPPPS